MGPIDDSGVADDTALEDFTNEDADVQPEPEVQPQAAVAEGTVTEMKTATAEAPAKKGKNKTAAAKAAPVKKAAKAKVGGPGRPSAYLGMKLFKTEGENKHKLQPGGKREGFFKMIKNGMKFETYMENGGSASELKVLLFYKMIEVRKD